MSGNGSLSSADLELQRLLQLPTESEIFDRTTATQDNIAMVFEHKFHEVLRFCNTWGKWFHWDESRWKEERTLLAFHFARLLARKHNPEMNKETAKASFARGVETMARASRTFATLPEQWDCNSKLLNTPQSTQDLDTAILRPHAKSDHITKCTRVAPASGPHPIFDMFLRDITLNDDALAAYHQRALGACLSGAIQDNFLLFWYGTGQNGKNTLGDLVEWILGDYAKVIPSETLMVDRHGPRHPTDLANLRGVRLAISSEVEEGSYFNEQRIKQLTGDAMIPARFMRQDFFEFQRTHKHLVYGNNRPMLRVVDPAMRARLHIVPFKAHFPPEARDPNMADKLKAEAPQILQWLIDGHEQWAEDGYLKKCSAVQEETNAYFEEQSTPDMWIAECCLVDEMETCSAKELYASFKQWKEERGEGVMAMGRWSQWMGQRYQRKNWSGRSAYKGVTVLQRSSVNNAGNA